jgi:hypothetical protein
MVQVTAADPLWPEVSVAATELWNVPAVAGVPQIRPLAGSIARPGGSVPP